MTQWGTDRESWSLANRHVTHQNALEGHQSFSSIPVSPEIQQWLVREWPWLLCTKTQACAERQVFLVPEWEFMACKAWGHPSPHGDSLHWTWVPGAQLLVGKEVKSCIRSREPGLIFPLAPLMRLHFKAGHESTGAAATSHCGQRVVHSSLFLSKKLRPLFCHHQAPAEGRFYYYIQSCLPAGYSFTRSEESRVRLWLWKIDGLWSLCAHSQWG